MDGILITKTKRGPLSDSFEFLNGPFYTLYERTGSSALAAVGQFAAKKALVSDQVRNKRRVFLAKTLSMQY